MMRSLSRQGYEKKPKSWDNLIIKLKAPGKNSGAYFFGFFGIFFEKGVDNYAPLVYNIVRKLREELNLTNIKKYERGKEK